MLEGYVLHAIAYKDTSLIVNCLVKDHGIVKFVAKGAKRYKSQFFGILQPFIPILLYWKDYHHDLATLYKAEAYGAPHMLSGRYLFSALYINELLLRLLVPHEPANELFEHYHKFLLELKKYNKNTNNDIILQQKLRSLEKKILKAIGYELILNVESSNGKSIEPDGKYYFDLEEGVKKLEDGGNNLVKNLINGSSLLALHHDIFSDSIQLKQAKLFMRNILAHFLGDRPLAVKNLFL